MLSASPISAPAAQTSGWDTVPPLAGDQGYMSALIDLYPERDSDLEAFYNDHCVREESCMVERVVSKGTPPPPPRSSCFRYESQCRTVMLEA